jgi:tetratricopeptide (TPR) repeat protein
MINGQIAQVKRLKKDYDGAIASYQKVLAADPNNDKAKIEIGMTYLEKSDFANAEKTLMEVAQSVSANREVFYNLGEVKFVKGEIEEASAWYQKAADADPSWGKPLYKLALVQLNKGDKSATLKALERVIAADPTSQEAAQAKTVIDQLKK